MKLQELHEGAESAADKIAKGLSGIKGVKVVVSAADYDDLDGNPLPETYKVKVTYTPDRGVKPTESIKFYKTADGDWEYLSDSGNSGNENMADTIADLRKEIEVAQKFHGKGAKVDESIGSKLFKAFWETTPKEIMRRQQELTDQQVLDLYGQGMDDSHRGSPRNIQMRALSKEIKRRGLKVAEAALTEGYEAKVLAVLNTNDLTDCHFKGGKLFCDKADHDKVIKVLKKAEARHEFYMPEVVAIEG